MPIISDQMKKATKKAAAQEKRRREEEEHRLREEQAKKEQEEREAKEREEQEKKQKKMEKKQKRKERHDRAKKDRQELEKRANMRKEMALIRKSLGAKQIKDEGMIERHGLNILRTELKSGAHSKVYKAKHGDQENIVCKVVIVDKTPQPYRQNLLDVSLQVQRYVGGGATDPHSTKGGSEPKHPGLIKVVDIFATDKKAYIFMEEVEPKSVIDAKFKKAETPDESEVKKSIKELAQALQYLHGIGVAHNNLRPSSVVYNKDNQLKLVGMDMCCFYWDSDMETVVPKKRIHKKEFDKSPHLPPEAFKDETYDPSLADIWGLGVIMCLMIAKESPFKIKSEQPFDEQWKAFAQTKQFSDEAKQLLDRIFVVEAINRPNITEILEDSYLKGEGNVGHAVKAPPAPTDSSQPPANGPGGAGGAGAADVANASDEPLPKS